MPCRKFLVKGVKYSNVLPFSILLSTINLVNKTAVNRVVPIPIINVTAKPLMGPIPTRNKINAVKKVVILPSRIADKECLKPSSTASAKPFPARNSSLIRSYIITLASTAIPSVNTIPAIPGKVKVELNPAIKPTIINKFNKSTRLATTPADE